MSWREEMTSAPMARAAVVAADDDLGRVLLDVAEAAVFAPDRDPHPESVPAGASPERSLAEVTASAHRGSGCAVLIGWIASRNLEPLAARLEPLGGAIVPLDMPRGVIPPTAHGPGSVGGALRPLVSTYGVVPYRDLDPTLFAALTYVVMFGMMFGDVAHGLILGLFGVVAGTRDHGRLASIRGAGPFLIGAGVSSMLFGLLYGEAFGPTGLVPTLWLRPLEEPERLLIAGLILGIGLLSVTFVIATINRWREAGPSLAVYDASGLGGALLFAGAAFWLASTSLSPGWLGTAGFGLMALGSVLVFTGLVVASGPGATGWMQAVIEMFDTVLRMGSNMVSFTRLAAFGLTHAVITEVVWDGTVSLWNRSSAVGLVGAVLLFAIGNAAAFALSGLAGSIQALRLEYYELFSRLFLTQGRPFVPWHLPNPRSDPT